VVIVYPVFVFIDASAEGYEGDDENIYGEEGGTF
jgi:hypothetical protein